MEKPAKGDQGKAPGNDRSQRRGKPDQSAEKKQAVRFSSAVPARVEELIGKTGTRGDAMQVRCKILDGRDKNKIIRRNVKGPVRIGDMLMLRETEIEAQKLTQRRR